MKVYWPFAKAMIQEFFTYGVNAYIYITGELLQTVVLIYIWHAVFSSAKGEVINGFTFDEMVAYVVISIITVMLTSNDVHWSIGHEVRTGDIAMNLIKPVSYQLRMFASTVGYWVVNFLLIALPMWLIYTIYDIVFNGRMPQLTVIIAFLISCLFSALLLFAINFAFGLAAFYVTYLFGFIFAKDAIFRFFSGALIPLSFFPEGAQQVFQWLPFGSLVYTPTMIYLGKYSGRQMWIALVVQLVWVVVMIIINQILWQRAVRRLCIMGG